MASKFNDIWTQKARALGYPSRAVFKLLEAQKKYRIIRPGSHVIDLGCAPGSWTKMASKLAGTKGFVLGMDLTQLSHNEQKDMGVDTADMNLPVMNKHSLSPARARSRDVEDESSPLEGGLLKSERKLIRSRSPVKFIQGDVTEWVPPPAMQHNFDVILSDMAPKTTGTPDYDSMISMDLCHSVLDLCSRIVKPPFTRTEPLTDAEWERVKLEYSQEQARANNSDAGPSSATVREMVAQEVRLLSDKKQVSLEEGVHDPSILKKALRRNAVLKQRDNTGAEENTSFHQLTDADRATHVGAVRVEGPWLRQVRAGNEVHTYYHGVLLLKVFQGEHFAGLMRRIKTLFNIVHTFKPASSRSESVEVFIYARGYRGPLEMYKPSANDVVMPSDADSVARQAEGSAETEPGARSVSKKRPKKPWPSTKGITATPAERGENVGLVDSAAVYKPRFSGMSVEDIYAKLGHGEDESFTNQEMARTQGLRKAYHDAALNSDVGETVRSAIQARSLRPDFMRPEEALYDVVDPNLATIKLTNEYLSYGTDENDADAAAVRTLLVDTESAELDPVNSIYGSAALNRVPTPEELAQAMSMYWDEGMEFADELQRDHGYKQADGFEEFDDEGQ